MRLRRETGDFQIKVAQGETPLAYTVNSIRPGLSAEDLIGEVVDMGDGSFAAIVSTNDDSATGEIIAIAVGVIGNNFTFKYDPATGSIVYMPSGSSTPGGNVGGLVPTS